MAQYDLQGARQAGIPDSEIADALAPKVNYDLDGARRAGIPDSEIADALATKFNSTPGGAATGIQRQPRLLSPTSEAVSEISGAGAIGAAMGAAAPEILSGAAQVVRPFPLLSGMAPALEAGSRVARVAGRPAGAAVGAISGLAGETAGQAAETADAPQWAAEGARFVAGGVSPAAIPVAKFALNLFVRKLPTSIEETALKNTAKILAAKLEGRPQDIDADEAALLNKLVGELRGGAATDKPMRGVYDILQSGAKSKLAVGEQEAHSIIANANASIQRELDAATKTGTYTKAAEERIRSRGETALSTAQLQRLNVGRDLDPTDIGTRLREPIVARNQAAIEARETQIKADKAARDRIVNAKQSRGVFVNSTPEYEQLISSLEAELVPGKHTPEVAKNFQTILSSVRNAEKDVFGQNKPVDFEAIDEARRRLGTVFTGQPAEGYEAIGEQIAKKYYGMLSRVQGRFGEEPQKRLLSNYAENTAGLEQFRTKLGQTATAVDKFDDELFRTDPSALPRTYFATKTKINELIKLSGDRATVVEAARDFASAELRDLDAKGVRNWMTKRREMLEMLPEVRTAVVKYANQLQHGEQTALAAERGIWKLTAYQEGRQRMTQQQAGAIEREAATRAGQATTQRGQEAISLLGPKGEMFPVQNVKALIEKGDSQAWALAAPQILASPGGKEMLADSIRQTLADKAMTSTKGLSAFFDNNVRPALTATKAMDSTTMGRISAQLSAIENMRVPEPEKLGMARRFILQAFGGYAATLGARAGTAASTSLADLIPR